MTIHTCDKCDATIERESMQVGIGFTYRVELCKECAEPLIAFLKNANLLQEQLQRYGFIESPLSEAQSLAAAHHETLPHAWTKEGQDAANYTRDLHDSMQPEISPAAS